MVPTSRSPRASSILALLLAATLLAGACSSSDDSSDSSDTSEGAGDESSSPVLGGDLTYALEAETSGGWCIGEAQLAISGMMVAWSVYDFLFVPGESIDAGGDGWVPFLVDTYEVNDDFTEWTLHIRDGVKFHDGSDLDATVVKNNIDVTLGRYPGRTSLLGAFTYANIDTVETTDDMTVVITTKAPWPALPAYLYGGARFGIMAQAQIDDPDTCDRNLIGTGPYKLDEWVVNDHLTASKNADYWRTDDEGNQLPYLDSITFRPVPDAQARVNGVLSGEYDMTMTSQASSTEVLMEAADAGDIDIIQSSFNTETAFMMFNESHPPFDDPVARQAVASAIDTESYSEVVALGLTEPSNGPFPPGAPGYLEDTGYPGFDLDRAKELAADYEARNGEPISFAFSHPADPDSTSAAQFLQQQVQAAGIEMNLQAAEQATLISTALGSDWDAMAFRNFPGGVPDGNYVWWYSGSPVNLGRINDPEIDGYLDAGRSELDRDTALGIYEDLNRRMAEQVHFAWIDWTLWTIGSQTNVHGIQGAVLPGGVTPSPGLGTGHATSGIWLDPQ